MSKPKPLFLQHYSTQQILVLIPALLLAVRLLWYDTPLFSITHTVVMAYALIIFSIQAYKHIKKGLYLVFYLLFSLIFLGTVGSALARIDGLSFFNPLDAIHLLLFPGLIVFIIIMILYVFDNPNNKTYWVLGSITLLLMAFQYAWPIEFPEPYTKSLAIILCSTLLLFSLLAKERSFQLACLYMFIPISIHVVLWHTHHIYLFKTYIENGFPGVY